jgi:hypothetical protein
MAEYSGCKIVVRYLRATGIISSLRGLSFYTMDPRNPFHKGKWVLSVDLSICLHWLLRLRQKNALHHISICLRDLVLKRRVTSGVSAAIWQLPKSRQLLARSDPPARRLRPHSSDGSSNHVRYDRDITLRSNKSTLPFWLQELGLLKNLFGWRSSKPSRSPFLAHLAQGWLSLQHGNQNSIPVPSDRNTRISYSPLKPETKINTWGKINIWELDFNLKGIDQWEHAVLWMVKALCYKLESRGFESWCHSFFFSIIYSQRERDL